MSELSKQALRVENNTQFPNNNSGYITPSRLRGFNSDMIDSTVNQAQYTADSASWNAQIDALENFSSSLDNNFVSETQFGAYTSSNNTNVNNLSASSSLQQSEIDALIAFTGSVSSVATGSLLTTASATLNVITFTKGDASTFNVTVGADTTQLNAFTASQESKNATLAIYTASVNQQLASISSTTASLNTSVANLNLFTSSQNTKNATLATYTGSNDTKWSNLGAQSGSWITETESGSFLVTASFATQTLTFTKGNGSTFSVFIPDNTGSTTDLSSLNEFTASQNSKNATLATYTGSNDTKWSTLGSQSGSWITESESGSFLITASVTSNIITFTKGNNTQFSLTVGTDTTQLNAFTASQQLLNTTFATTGSNVFTGNQTLSGSIIISGSTLNVVSGSANGNIITNLGDTYTDTNPVQTIVSITSASYAALVSSSTYNPNTLYIISGAVSASNVDLSSLNAYTASNDIKWSNLGNQSGSWITESETGSFARYNVSNPWSADQTFTNITAVSASFQYVKTVFETASVIFSSGSNQFGDASNDVQTLYGSVRVVNELTASGLHYPTADGVADQFLSTNGAGALTFDWVKTLHQNIRNLDSVTINRGTPLYVSGSTGDNANVFVADANNPLRRPATLIAFDTTLAPNATGTAIISGEIQNVNTTGYSSGTVVYLAAGGGWTATRPTGSASVQVLGVVTLEATNGRGIVFNQVADGLPNIQQGYAWVGNVNSVPTAVATSSFGGSSTDISALNAFTASQYVSNSFFATTGSNQFYGDQYIWDADGLLQASLAVNEPQGVLEVGQVALKPLSGIVIPGDQTAINFENATDNTYNTSVENVNGIGLKFSPASATDAIFELFNHSLKVTNTFTASLTEGYVWVGDSTGTTYEVATSSFGGGGTIDTASFATTGSNQFTGSQNITGSLILAAPANPEGFVATITPDNVLGRLTINQTIQADSGIYMANNEALVFVDSVDGDWNARLVQVDGAGLKLSNEGSISGPTLTLDKYNLVITGSARGWVQDLTIASTTASIDLSAGNYFTLALSASATTHISASNIQPGQTVTLLLTTNTSSSVVFAPNILEPSGSFYVPSASGSKDIISLVAFDSNTLYAVSTKNMI